MEVIQPRVKETFIQTGRRGRDGELGQRGLRARQDLEDQGRQGYDWLTTQDSSWRSRQFHICVWINWEKKLGRVTDCATLGSSAGK